MKKTLIILTIAMMTVCSMVACGKEDPSTNQSTIEATEIEEPTVADPKGALNEIYSEIDIKGITSADDSVLKDKFAMDLDYIQDYWVQYSAKNHGVSDVFIIKPTVDSIEKVEEMLDNVKKQRVTEFTDYDVYNSLQISKDSVIYNRGDYVILLMLEDNSRGKEIISKYIPS